MIYWKFKYSRTQRALAVGVSAEVDIWVEVKGWMDEKSKIRLELFKKYFPEENKKLLLIDSKFYYKLEKIYKPIITNWEYAGNYNKVKKGK